LQSVSDDLISGAKESDTGGSKSMVARNFR